LGCARKRFRGVSSEGDNLSEDTPFRAALRTALSGRNGGSAEFFNSLPSVTLVLSGSDTSALPSTLSSNADEYA
jgi:hypothetical protein